MSAAGCDRRYLAATMIRVVTWIDRDGDARAALDWLAGTLVTKNDPSFVSAGAIAAVEWLRTNLRKPEQQSRCVALLRELATNTNHVWKN